MKLITVYTLPRDIECNNITTWDEESFGLTTTFVCPRYKGTNKSVIQTAINESAGVRNLNYTLYLGGIKILLNEYKHLALLETRTNKNRWKRSDISQLPPSIGKVWPDFRVVFDDNQIASVNLEYEIVFDEAQKTLAFSFVNEQLIVNWVELAEHCFIALDGNYHLKELRLTNINQ